jgi:BON domain
MRTDHTARLLLGIACGAATMYLLDPDRGRRRRAEVTQQMMRLGNLSGEAIGTTSRDAMNRTRGLLAQIVSWFSSQPADDRVLAERVRSRLGFLVDHPRSISVVANDGRITLSGPILAHEVERLLNDIRRIPGVRQVDNHLDVHQEPGDVSGL